jgi:poly(3-hydroxybutyrate) depolymerase
MSTLTDTQGRGAYRTRLLVLVSLVTVAAFACGPAAPSSGRSARDRTAINVWTIHYTAHNGADRLAYVVLPAWYGPDNNPPLPVVISPHGRGANGRSNAEFFGKLPARGRFAVISPDGMGRRTRRFSYGYAGQIDDLARMPKIATRALPFLRIDRSRIYALGSSMGGQETALLVARHPRLLAGAAAMDSVTDLGLRYAQLPKIPGGVDVQSVMRREVGGTPDRAARLYAARSALSQARAIAFSGVPLQIWWSYSDRIVTDQETQSEALFRKVRSLNRRARITAYAGRWQHSTEMRATSLLPIALAGFDLMPRGFKRLPRSVRYYAAAGKPGAIR